MQRTVAPRVAGAAWPVGSAGRRDARRHVAGRQERRVVDVDHRAAAGGRAASRSSAGQVVGRPRSRIDSCSSHRPMTLRRKRIVPSTPPSLVKFAARASSVSTGASSSTPTSDQVPLGDVRERRRRRGHGDDRRRGVVRPDRDDRRRAGQPGAAATSGSSRPTTSPGSRSGGRIPAGTSTRSASPVAQARRSHVEQPGGRGVGGLGPELAGEPVGRAGPGAAAASATVVERGPRGGQLVDRVERQVLQAVHRVQLVGRHQRAAPASRRRRCGRRGSSTGRRAARPSRRAGRSRRPRCRCRCRRPGPAASRSPVSISWRSPAMSQCRLPSAACTGPFGKRCTSSSVSTSGPTVPTMTRPLDAPRSTAARRRSIGMARQRRNAAATPASTGMCRPVVWVSSPPVSANTALATCSGSTSRLRRVRWA